MSVDLEALNGQCLRFHAIPDFYSSEASAHTLLAALPVDQRVCLVHALRREWQLSISGKVVMTDSFENCVTYLASRCEP